MTVEIRLPAENPRFVPRRPGGPRRPDHPGTAVRIEGQLFEVVGDVRQGEEWVYSLEPWEESQTVRGLVEWGPEAEKAFKERVRREAQFKRRASVAWGLQALLGFLPAKHQERLSSSVGLDPGKATFWSAAMESAICFPLAVLYGIGLSAGGLGGTMGLSGWNGLLRLPPWVGLLAAAGALEGFMRLMFTIATHDPVGSVPFALLDRRLRDPAADDLMADDYTTTGEFLIARTPVPKPWWEEPEGVWWQGEPYKLADHQRIHMSYLYKFVRLRPEEAGEGFAVVDPLQERVRNVASDRSFVFSPLWGYLPADLQAKLEALGRYRPVPAVRLSIALNLFLALPIIVADLWAFASGTAGLWNGLRFLFGLVLFHESLLRLYRLFQGTVTGSFLGALVKPLYYLAFREGLD
jgi:hypothetical protein